MPMERYWNVVGTFLGRLWVWEKRSCNDGETKLWDDNYRKTHGLLWERVCHVDFVVCVVMGKFVPVIV